MLRGLAKAGFATVEEPGRRIVAAELVGDGTALPWVDPVAFARRAVELALTDWHAAQNLPGRVFYDRGLGDALAALEHASGQMSLDVMDLATRYDRRVFVVPPWPEIYRTERERQHPFTEAVAEYHRLCRFYQTHAFDLVVVPKTSVERRVALVVSQLPM